MWGRSSLVISFIFTFWLVAQAKPVAKPVGIAPVAYFESKCARCHGTGGSLFVEGFCKELDDPSLTALVRRMSSGPAQSPLTGDDLYTQVAFLRSIIAKEPFIVWTAFDRGKLTGEVSLGASASAKRFGRSIPISVKGGRWELRASSPAGIEITATVGTKKSVLDLNESNSSHRRKFAK